MDFWNAMLLEDWQIAFTISKNTSTLFAAMSKLKS